MKKIGGNILFVLVCVMSTVAQTWAPDKGNDTYTNPLFFEEFSDPCMVRVGHDDYLTGNTMRCMPGLPILHSRDLLNWSLNSFVFVRLDFGSEFSFQDDKDMCEQGILAPSFAYTDSTSCIFANVNSHASQCYNAKSHYGSWEHGEMKKDILDLNYFFETVGKKYMSWRAMENHLAQLNDDQIDIITDCGQAQRPCQHVGTPSRRQYPL